MSYNNYPSGIPPYTPETHITDRISPLNHFTLQNGISRDISSLQHNINSTHLFASGYLNPITSGYFQTINTYNLYANNVSGVNLNINNVDEPFRVNLHILSGLYISDSNIKDISTANFKSSYFSANVSGFISSSSSIVSGYLYDWLLSDNCTFKNGLFNKLNLSTGTINVDGSIIIENNSALNASGSLNESSLYWNAFGGHNHTINKINPNNIISGNVTFSDDFNINTTNSFIDVKQGYLDADTYELETIFEENQMYVLDCFEGVYSGLAPNIITGNIRDLDLGLDLMVSYRDEVYATSTTLPTGCLDTNKCFVYTSKDFFTWEAHMMSGYFKDGTDYISEPGIAKISDMKTFRDHICLLYNKQIEGGNYCSILLNYPPNYNIDNLNENTASDKNINKYYGANNQAFNSSIYGNSLFINGDINIWTLGYTYPHKEPNGIPKWDKHCLGLGPQANQSALTNATGQDLSYASEELLYSYPFMNAYGNTNFWVDGMYDGREGYLSEIDNSGYYQKLPRNDDNFSGYFAGLFGNGFNEITDVIYTQGRFSLGNKCSFTNLVYNTLGRADFIENNFENNYLVFGNNFTQVKTTENDNIFGGNTPICMNLDSKLFTFSSNITYVIPTYYEMKLTSGTASYFPNVLHGSRSLMEDTLFFKIPSYLYLNINYLNNLTNSNIFKEWPDNSGRLWSDYTAPNEGRDFFVNQCPWNPGLGVFPFGGSGQIYYKKDNDVTPTKVIYELSSGNINGIIIPFGTFTSGVFGDHRNLPTYYENIVHEGFWENKSFDWYYVPEVDHSSDIEYFAASGNAPEAPSGVYQKSYYYSKPKKPVQHNGVVYCILENETGFIIIGNDGPEYVNDDILYSDLIKFGNTLYGVGSRVTQENNVFTYSTVLSTIRRNNSTYIPLSANVTQDRLTPKFVIHNNLLYIGVGNGKFIVKVPSHKDLCLTNNI